MANQMPGVIKLKFFTLLITNQRLCRQIGLCIHFAIWLQMTQGNAPCLVYYFVKLVWTKTWSNSHIEVVMMVICTL